jgi:glucose/arabinose dehydrogenase
MRQFRLHATFAALLCAATAAWAQQPPAEEPGWAKGRPKTEAAQRMAPVPAFPIPTAADQLPTAKFKLPPGFKVETWASGVLDARGLRQGPGDTVFVSTLFVGNKVYAVVPKGNTREVKTVIDKMEKAAGIEYHKGSLYVATHKQILRYDNIDSKLDNPGQPTVLYDKLPGGEDHSWKFIRIHKDKLYFPIGAPCNICDPGEYAKIYRMNLDGSGMETVASGVRNTVGFDFDPRPTGSGSPTTAATGSAKRSPTTSSTSSRGPTSTSAIRTATRATSPIRSSAGASRAATTRSPQRSSARTPARWG